MPNDHDRPDAAGPERSTSPTASQANYGAVPFEELKELFVGAPAPPEDEAPAGGGMALGALAEAPAQDLSPPPRAEDAVPAASPAPGLVGPGDALMDSDDSDEVEGAEDLVESASSDPRDEAQAGSMGDELFDHVLDAEPEVAILDEEDDQPVIEMSAAPEPEDDAQPPASPIDFDAGLIAGTEDAAPTMEIEAPPSERIPLDESDPTRAVEDAADDSGAATDPAMVSMTVRTAAMITDDDAAPTVEMEARPSSSLVEDAAPAIEIEATPSTAIYIEALGGPSASSLFDEGDADPRVDVGAPHRRPPTPPPRPHHPAAHAVETRAAEIVGEARAAGTLHNPLLDHEAFRRETHRLARAREWHNLAALTSAAIDHATWVTLPETRAALLSDLARIHRDRLQDPVGTESAYQRLARVDPIHEEAIDYLEKVYRERADHRAIYNLYTAAIEPSWDPHQRLEWTRRSAAIATGPLASADLAIEAWERLERLGDAGAETAAALGELYRCAGRWLELARFLEQRAGALGGTERTVALREAAEAYLSAVGDHHQAGPLVEEILAGRPDDVVALLAEARVLFARGDLAALGALASRSLPAAPRSAVLDLRKSVAELLSMARDEERAVAAFDRVLALDPSDGEALAARERYLLAADKTEELVESLRARAARAPGEAERTALLAQVADLVETRLDDPRGALLTWESYGTGPSGGGLAAHQALERLHDRLGDLDGVARSLEAQLRLGRRPGDRAPLLRRLAELTAHRMGDDVRARAALEELLLIVPDDGAAHDELVALLARQQDGAAIDRALTARAWRSGDEQEAIALLRRAAQNADERLREPDRSRAASLAWQRVLHLAPRDPAALAALVEHRRVVGRSRDLIAALEAELRAWPASDVPGRCARALEIGRLWEGDGQHVAALGAYERALAWEPTDDGALEGLARLHRGREAGAAAGAFEAAAVICGERGEVARRSALLGRALALSDGGDAIGRFYRLRRALWLSVDAPEALEALEVAAAGSAAWAELAAVYESLAASAADPSARAAHHQALAMVAEAHLGDPVRALLALTADRRLPIIDAGGDAERVADGPPDTALPAGAEAMLRGIARLVDVTGRHEDQLAFLESSTGAALPRQARIEMLRHKVAVCEDRLLDAHRALEACARILRVNPHDAAALADAERLATKKGLWRALDALYGEVGDAAGDRATRLLIGARRHVLRRDRLADPAGALDELLLMSRLAPDQPGLSEALLAAADLGDAYHLALPLLEAHARAAGEAASSDDLARLAGLHEHQREDRQHAFELYAEAFVLEPSARDLEEELVRLADESGRIAELGAVLGDAAARAESSARKLELYGRITRLSPETLDGADFSLDAQRRVVALAPAHRPALEALIEHDRRGSAWRDLRDRLQRWAELTSDTSDASAEGAVRVARLVEAAQISQQRLGDPEAALMAYAEVLELDPDNRDALDGVHSLTDGAASPRFELKRLRIELARAEPGRRASLLVACARIQQTALGEPDAAIDTLTTLLAETGPDGPGYAPLATLYRARGDYAALGALLEARAQHHRDPAARAEVLDEAIALCEEHPELAGTQRRERLERALLALRPEDLPARRRLLSHYRDTARHRELAALLDETLRAPGLPMESDERRALEGELSVVLGLALGDREGAEAILAASSVDDEDDLGRAELLLARAGNALRGGDFGAYLELRLAHARTLGPVHAALVLCHLAEACDERPPFQSRVAGLYREARSIDPHNGPAAEALKAIGRRARNWRSLSALLPDGDEGTLSFAARALRLVGHGDGARRDRARATDFYLRAVATDPDCHAAWDALHALRAASGDHEAALAARRSSLAAWERSTPPSPAALHEHAARIEALAAAHRSSGLEVERAAAARLSLRAHRLDPSHPGAALAVADHQREAGQLEAAFVLYDRVLQRASGASALGGASVTSGAQALLLPAEARLHATFRRGAIAIALGRARAGQADLEAALRLDPLHGGALEALADALAASGRVVSAAERYLRALVVSPEPRRRMTLYASLGRLSDDRLGNPEEAGVCYDLALGAATLAGGTELPDLLSITLRALALDRKLGRPERALALLDRLLPQIHDTHELASLWTERAALLVSLGDEHAAMEAFDMALSYDPGSAGALAGLSRILERRGDWEQLAQIFEARAETGTDEERAEALSALARLSSIRDPDPRHAPPEALRATAAMAPDPNPATLTSTDAASDAANTDGKLR